MVKGVLAGLAEGESYRRRNDAFYADYQAGTLDVELSEAELAARKGAWTPRPSFYTSGTLWKYAQTVGPAEKGAVTHPGGQAEAHVYADI